MDCTLCSKKCQLSNSSSFTSSGFSIGVKSSDDKIYCIECYDVLDWATNTTTKTSNKSTNTEKKQLPDSAKLINSNHIFCSKCKIFFGESKCSKCGFKNPLFR